MGMFRLQLVDGLSGAERAVLRAHHDALCAAWDTVRGRVDQWAQTNALGEAWRQFEAFQLLEHLLDQPDRIDYRSLIRQAHQLHQQGVNEAALFRLLSEIKREFVAQLEGNCNHELLKALCHLIDLLHGLFLTVYQMARLIERFEAAARFEVGRVEKMFAMIEQPPRTLIQAYYDHQAWKQRAYRIAMGEALHEAPELSPERCALGQWLALEGARYVPEADRQQLDAAHERVHTLGRQLLACAELDDLECMMDLIWELENASDEVGRYLLGIMDRIFMETATRDALTGLPNRRSFELDYHKLIRLARRYGLSVGVHLIDLDHFKHINDRYGHLKGDAALKAVVAALQRALREDDHLYRWGGEEFIVLTLHDEPEGAERFARRLIAQYDPVSLQQKLGLDRPLTFSMGVVLQPSGFEEIPPDHRVFSAADQLLYRAKENGRNQVWFGLIDEKGHLSEDTVHRV